MQEMYKRSQLVDLCPPVGYALMTSTLSQQHLYLFLEVIGTVLHFFLSLPSYLGPTNYHRALML